MVLRETRKYKYRKSGQPRKFYGCSQFPNCRAAHGAHPDGRPLGVPANGPTKRARVAAHAAFDKFWKRKHWKRSRGYRWLQGELNLANKQCHIGLFDEVMCAKVIALCQKGNDES